MILSVVIVNYNVQYFLEQALLSVQKASKGLESEIIVVDNNSQDDSVKLVKEKFPEVILLFNKENTGFSKANNQGIRISKGKYILLLNPDTVVSEDTLHKCVSFMENSPETGCLGVKMIDGSGTFLPESKRGFPSPFVAFSKTFGLSALFPKSRLFNRYHLGYLDKDENHEVDIVAGAFMMLRRVVLDEVGLLDEEFFMYGEDIDLSYRIKLAGYKVQYLSETTIIHYKGESTRKGSLNYVRTFYQAMIIFARKHFSGREAAFFIFSIYAAVYFRAFLTLLSGFFKRIHIALLDGVFIFGGLVFLKNFWANYYYHDSAYYSDAFLYFNVPIYIALWLGTLFFTGGYDEPYNLRRMYRGLLLGSLAIAAVYAFLPLHLRPSRAIILMGVVWTLASTTIVRELLHFFKTGSFTLGRSQIKKLIIVGSGEESQRVRNLLTSAQVQKNIVGTVAPTGGFNQDGHDYLSTLNNLEDVVHIYEAEEIIFCSKDVSADHIMKWMVKLGPDIQYRIVPGEGVSIIGSSSKNTAGELYTIDIRFKISTPMARRNKRVLDLCFSIACILVSPLLVFYLQNRQGLFQNTLKVMMGKKSWVGYSEEAERVFNLPVLKSGIITPADVFQNRILDKGTIERLNFLYAKDYSVWKDVEIIWSCARQLGN